MKKQIIKSISKKPKNIIKSKVHKKITSTEKKQTQRKKKFPKKRTTFNFFSSLLKFFRRKAN